MKADKFKKTIEWYDKHLKEFTKSLKRKPALDQVNSFFSLLSDKPLILDAGCGAGRYISFLIKKGAKVIGVDLSEENIKIARKLNPKTEIIKADFRDLPFRNNYFDGIWAHASLIHFTNMREVLKSLKEFYRVLKNKGVVHVLVKSFCGKRTDEIEGRNFIYFKAEEIKSLLIKAGFKIYKTYEYQENKRYPERESKNKWIEVLAKK